jgi:hypothetical protein
MYIPDIRMYLEAAATSGTIGRTCFTRRGDSPAKIRLAKDQYRDKHVSGATESTAKWHSDFLRLAKLVNVERPHFCAPRIRSGLTQRCSNTQLRNRRANRWQLEFSRSSASEVHLTPFEQFRISKSTCLYRRLEQVFAGKQGSTHAFYANMNRTLPTEYL